MKLLRRLALVLAELILFVVVTVVLLYPSLLEQVMQDIGSVDFVIRAAIVALVDLILLAAIFYQLQPQRYRGDGLMVKAGDSVASLSAESVRQNVLKAVRNIEDIEQVECRTKSEKGAAYIELDVVTSRDDINVPGKQKEIDRAIKQVVTKQMGVRMSRPPVVNIRLASAAQVEPSLQKSTGVHSASPSPEAQKPAPFAPVSTLLSTPKDAKEPVEPEEEKKLTESEPTL